MEIQIVHTARWRVTSPVIQGVSGQPIAALTAFLEALEDQYSAHARGILALIKRAADLEEGPFGLPTDLCHKVTPKKSASPIYELIKGDLRVFFFTDGSDRIMVCTSGVIKKGQKADPKKVAEAQRIKALYDLAKQQNCLSIKEES